MIAFGLPFIIGYPLLLTVFILLSNYLFSKTEFATYLYSFIALSLVSKLSETRRNDFLKSIFSKNHYLQTRIVENFVYCLPFLIFFVYKGLYLSSLTTALLAISLTLLSFNTNFSLTIPTPFYKTPFEFTVGFRKTFLAFPIAYFLTFISIKVGNFNLGVFSILFITLICFSYYLKIENEFLIWNFNISSKKFLFKKTKTCLINFTLLSFPVLGALGIYFFEQLDILILFFVLCHLYLTAIIYAKYSSFPMEINLPQITTLLISFIFPPLLLVIIPHFYAQSIKRLNTILA